VRVARQEQRPVDPLGSAETDDRLADGDDVVLGESRVERRAAVT